jgi:RNA polymerase sigma factor (sigma-70 family)
MGIVRISKCREFMKAKSLSNKTDEELMLLYQNGDTEAFHALYERHAGKIFGYLKKKTKNQEEALDFFQEVFSKIHRSKHLYNKSLPALPWIFTVTRTTLIDCLRKEKASMNKVEMDLETIPIEEKNESLDIQQIIPSLARLPENQKIALELRYLEEKTFEEIAKDLKTSEVNVRKLISRGVQRIKELIGDSGHE